MWNKTRMKTRGFCHAGHLQIVELSNKKDRQKKKGIFIQALQLISSVQSIQYVKT